MGVEKEERGGKKQTAVWVLSGRVVVPMRAREVREAANLSRGTPTNSVCTCDEVKHRAPARKKNFKKENKHWLLL